MNLNRLRPTNIKDLAGWLSSVVNDAARDAREAGLSDAMVHAVLKSLADAYDVTGRARRANGTDNSEIEHLRRENEKMHKRMDAYLNDMGGDPEMLKAALCEALDLALLGENSFGKEQLERIAELRATFLGDKP